MATRRKGNQSVTLKLLVLTVLLMTFLIPPLSFGQTGPSISVHPGEQLYLPDNLLTRKWEAVFLIRAMGEQPNPCTGILYVDVSPVTVGSSFCGYIETITNLGITAGCGAGKYCPEGSVTRKEIAVFLLTALGEEPSELCTGTMFNDVTNGSVGPAYCRFIEKSASLGITKGCDELSGSTIFCPNNPVSRAEMAAMTIRAFKDPLAVYSLTPYFSDVSDTHPFFNFIQLIMDEGILPDEVIPMGFNFGQASANLPRTQAFTITNTGDQSLQIGSISITGNPSSFIKKNDACSSQIVLPSGNCTLDVVFSPSVAGATEANLNIPSNDSQLPVLVLGLTGYGQQVVISGYLREGGTGLPGIAMNGLPGNPLTDQNGFYTATIDYGWSGTVTPSKYGYLFQPPSRTYAIVTGNQTNQDYIVHTNPPSVDLGITTGAPGTTVTVPLILRNAPGYQISTLSSDITFDVHKLENPVVNIGPAADSAGKTILSNVVSPGVFRIGIISMGEPTLIGDGIAANVSFDIKQGTGNTTVVLENSPQGSAPLGADVGMIGRNGMVNIITQRFNDVPDGHWAEDHIYALSGFGITSGCGNNNYCADNPITRGQMAVFIEGALGHPANICAGRFADVPIDNPFCGFIERMADDGITSGCGGNNFCPNDPVTRGQMAVFIEAALGNSANPCTSQFADVSLDNPFCGFIERLADDGITGGCGGNNFCPNNPVTRGQMAVFLVAAPEPLNP